MANPGLKFDPEFKFSYFYMSVCCETLKMKTPIDQDKVPEEIFSNL